MDRITVSSALEILEELRNALEAAYWDAGGLQQKDTIFDIVTTTNGELNELAKLSINDYSMGYEPVTGPFQASARKFKQLQLRIDDWFPRTSTADQLHESLSNAEKLISTKYL